jgi:hypothetical protein
MTATMHKVKKATVRDISVAMYESSNPIKPPIIKYQKYFI